MRTAGRVCTTIARVFALLVLAVAGIGWAASNQWGLWGEFWAGWACTFPVTLPVVVRELTPRRDSRDRK